MTAPSGRFLSLRWRLMGPLLVLWGVAMGLLVTLIHTSILERFRALVEELGLNPGQVFGIMRVAITGQKISPPLFESMEIIGREKVLARMRHAVELLQSA